MVDVSRFSIAYGTGLLALMLSCGRHHPDAPDVAIDAPVQTGCTDDLSCFQVDCASKGLPDTTVSGFVHAPNGTLPLFGVNVYVPDSDPGPLTPGVSCGRCDITLPGNPIATTTTDETGHFTLPSVPATANVPIVIQVGKWRKQIKLASVAACQDTQLPVIDTDLPKTAHDTGGDIVSVDMPQIAITTGNSDALECLPRKLGIADSEFTTDAGSGHVHLYSGNGTNYFQAGFNGAAAAVPMNDESTLWNAGSGSSATQIAASAAKLANYDIMFFSCEGGQLRGSGDKPQVAMDNVKAYANLGGRIFMSHWHNIWIGGDQNDSTHGEADWEPIATWNYPDPQVQDSVTTVVDQTTAHGVSYATWLENVGASPTPDEVAITQARYTCSSLNDPTASRYIYVDPTNPGPPNDTTAITKGARAGETEASVTNFEFTTDINAPIDQRCGKVVFSDMHVSATSKSVAGSGATGTEPYPAGCDTGDLTPQEKALAFIFFDIASCIGPIS
jgi:hypothetical protein